MAAGVIPELLFSASAADGSLSLSLPARKLKLSPLFSLQRNKWVSERQRFTLYIPFWKPSVIFQPLQMLGLS